MSSEVLAAALARVMETPDLDPERMADGMAYVASHVTDPRAVADMMINRIMSDSLR
ncbi:MAG: hypothetical protein HGB10_00390 [Coriobacteriia bacterium]|nr:hypothetical protein [Coriobacteriia bacterium]